MTSAAMTSNYDKYQTKNPLMQRIIRRFVSRVVSHVARAEPERVIDLGCGEGMIARELERLPSPPVYRGIELNPDAVRVAREEVPGCEFIEADILRYPVEPGWADVALCLEVMEHLDDPIPLVERVAEWTSGIAIVSVPWEPFFRAGNFARGNYVRRLGNHPEHVQQFGPGSFRRLVERSFSVVRVESCFPWLIALAAAPRRARR